MEEKGLLEYNKERKKEMGAVGKQVKCPVCPNRLFDTVSAKEAEIIIKCSKCKNYINISIYNNRIKATAL